MSLFKALFDIKKEEIPFSILMSLYFFLVTTSFWILKPIKKSLFIDYYKIHEGLTILKWSLLGSQAELLAKVLNMIVAVGAVAVFTLLARRFIRQQLTIIFSLFFIVCYFLYIPILPSVNQKVFSISKDFIYPLNTGKLLSKNLYEVFKHHDRPISPKAAVSKIKKNKLWKITDQDNNRIYSVKQNKKENALNVYMTQSGKDIQIWSFYLFGDLFITLMAVTFFAFLNDSVTAEPAKRTYGLIGFGGVTGGAFGALSVRAMTDKLNNIPWLIILILLAIIIILLATLAGRLVHKPLKEKNHTKNTINSNFHPHKATLSAALEGAKLALSSKYLLAIIAIVGLYEMVSTIMDFQFTATVEHFIQGSTKEHFSLIFTITNFTAMFVQLFFTSLIMTKFGVGTALLILPIAVFSGSAGFFIAPILLFGSALNTIDNGFNYSINQSAKEALYVPISQDAKYKAKAFIDMFVHRFAKALAVGLSLMITTTFAKFSSIRWLSFVTVGILIVWILAAKYAGNRFKIRAN